MCARALLKAAPPWASAVALQAQCVAAIPLAELAVAIGRIPRLRAAVGFELTPR